jgi:hypothetical protein
VADDVRIALLGPLELRAGTAPPVVEVAGSRLRRLLPGALESHPSGYRLDVPAEAVDAFRFEALARPGWPPRPRRGSWAGRPTGGGPGAPG